MTHKKPKTRYRLRNWREYHRALVGRGSLTRWITEDGVQTWQVSEPEAKRGHPRTSTETARLTMATLQERYPLGLRQTQGVMEAIGTGLPLTGAIPDYSPLSRRRSTLEVVWPRPRTKEALHVGVASAGVKVFGAGEWKVRQHGYTKRRTWRKVPVGVDEARGELGAAVVTPNSSRESQELPDLLDQIAEESGQGSGAGAYDRRGGYAAIRQRSARATIPPPHHAKSWQHGNTNAARLAREETLRRIRQIGRTAGKREGGYHRRSLAETTLFRLTPICGERVSARSFAGQAAQVLARCATVNRLLQGGNPDSSVA